MKKVVERSLFSALILLAAFASPKLWAKEKALRLYTQYLLDVCETTPETGRDCHGNAEWSHPTLKPTNEFPCNGDPCDSSTIVFEGTSITLYYVLRESIDGRGGYTLWVLGYLGEAVEFEQILTGKIELKKVSDIKRIQRTTFGASYKQTPTGKHHIIVIVEPY